MRAYDASIRLLNDIGLPTDLAELNRGLAFLRASRFEEARAVFEPLHARWQNNSDDPHRPLPMLGLLPCLAHAGELDAWVQMARDCLPAIADSGLIDRDIAWMAGLAATTSPEPDERPLSAELQRLSDGQWAAMDESPSVTTAE